MWSTKYWDIDAEFGPRTNVVGHGTVYDTGSECVAQYGVDGFDIMVTRVWSPRRHGRAARAAEDPLRPGAYGELLGASRSQAERQADAQTQ